MNVGLGSFNEMPSEVQEAIASFLPEADTETLSLVSIVFQKTINDPAVWSQVSKRLNLPVSANPKRDVISYYQNSNNAILWALDEDSTLIRRTGNPLLQRRYIENYIEQNRDKLHSELLVSIAQGRYMVAKELIKAKVVLQPSDFELGMTEAISQGYQDIVQTLRDQGAPIPQKGVLYALSSRHFELADTLIKAGAFIDEECLECAIVSERPELVREILSKGVRPNPRLIDYANDEIRMILEESMQ